MISGETRPRLESFILLIYPTFSATKRTKVYFFIISLTPINYFCGLEKLDLELLQAHCRELKENLQKTQQDFDILQARHHNALLRLELAESNLEYSKQKVKRILRLLKRSVEKSQALVNELDGQFSKF
jgi:hypothetical protein